MGRSSKRVLRLQSSSSERSRTETVDHQNQNLIALVVWEEEHPVCSLLVMDRIDGLSLVCIRTLLVGL